MTVAEHVRPSVASLPTLATDKLRDFVVRRRFALSFGFMVFVTVLVTQQIIVSGPLVTFDYFVHSLRVDQRYPQVYEPIFYLVMIGQRGPTAIPALIIAAILAYRRRTARPFLLLGVSLLTLNLIVGFMKLWTARLKPADNSTALWSGGIIYPSGHASNVVVTWALVAYLLVRYGPLRRYWPGLAISTAATLIVGLGSIYLDTHWVSDIIAGWSIGAAIVLVAVRYDRRVAPGTRRRREPTTVTRLEPVAETPDRELARIAS